MRTVKISRTDGFTLLEVLVALAVLALALGAILKAGADNAAAAAYLRDKTFAHWVAVDRITELRLEPAWPSTGRRSGEVEFGDRRWHWESVVADTFDDTVRRVEVSVALPDDEDHPLVTRIGFLPRPNPAGAAAVASGGGR